MAFKLNKKKFFNGYIGFFCSCYFCFWKIMRNDCVLVFVKIILGGFGLKLIGKGNENGIKEKKRGESKGKWRGGMKMRGRVMIE